MNDFITEPEVSERALELLSWQAFMRPRREKHDPPAPSALSSLHGDVGTLPRYPERQNCAYNPMQCLYKYIRALERGRRDSLS